MVSIWFSEDYYMMISIFELRFLVSSEMPTTTADCCSLSYK